MPPTVLKFGLAGGLGDPSELYNISVMLIFCVIQLGPEGFCVAMLHKDQLL